MAERIQRKRTKGWRMPENAVSVCRPSIWGNDIRIGDDISYYTEGCHSATAADAVDLFRRFQLAHKAADPDRFERWISPLRGKDLACWCPLDQPCHADVLLELANAPE